MSDWDGSGLPPVAAARLERARRSGVRTSLLRVNGQAGLDSAGLIAVGEVMGCAVVHVGFQGYGGCGWMFGMPPPYTVTRRSGGTFTFGPYLDAMQGSWDLALRRLLQECRGLGADGVVGVSFEERSLGEQNTEFMAMGTAVRSLGQTHLERPFSTTLNGQDVAKLLHAGFAPAAAIVAMGLGVRHDDWRTQQATMAYAGNVEVPGYTDLVHAVRADARYELMRRCEAVGADGAVLTQALSLRVHELEVAENHRDHVALSSLVATAIVRAGPEHPDRARPLAMLSLK